jgi:AraC family transcriptional regulator of adaptative response/methylated-DNA-[protein]-cysteine methyltransferase
MNTLYTTSINTPLGTMTAVADEQALYVLEFTDNRQLQHKINRLEHATPLTMTDGSCHVLNQIAAELDLYFQGLLTQFTTPVALSGSSFQCRVWRQLQTIAHGTTQSYSMLAHSIAAPSAYRAVAQANAANKLAIIIPCHRVIAHNGNLSGYSSGIERKQWLLNHEKK